MFTLSHGNGYLRGWVLHPVDAKIERSDDPFRIRVEGDADGETEIWVAMLTGEGTPPRVQLVGEGMRSGLAVGSLQLFVQPDSKRFVLRNSGQ